MELIANHNPNSMIQEVVEQPSKNSKSPFIEANTQQVTLEHLKNDCIIPVFRDNETTISHSQFIGKAFEAVQELFPQIEVSQPDIRVSHVVKGRIPSAIAKSVKELLENEKTIYWERCAFIIDLPGITRSINGNTLNLSVGGVRSLNQENLHSKKSLEKFKVFIGFKNLVCTNLYISTDGFSNSIRIGSIEDLGGQMELLFSSYNQQEHLDTLSTMESHKFSERQFAHFVGKLRMYQHLGKEEQNDLFPMHFNDGQINTVVKNYYSCPNFGRNVDGSIDFWKLYNLFTEANKSSYIDSNLERNVSAYELVKNLGNSLKNNEPNWFLHN